MVLKYKGETQKYPVTFESGNGNTVIIKGDFPHKELGFSLYLNAFVDYGCSYEEFSTIYREVEGGCQFSNDGSVYVEPTQDIVVSVTWNDEDNKCEVRPESVTVNVYLNGEELETLILNDENEWKHTYEGCLLTDSYTLENIEEVEGYEMSTSGTTIEYTIPFAPEPTIEESLEDIYSALDAIDERVYTLENA